VENGTHVIVLHGLAKVAFEQCAIGLVHGLPKTHELFFIKALVAVVIKTRVNYCGTSEGAI
jgi:hypothetical protein